MDNLSSDLEVEKKSKRAIKDRFFADSHGLGLRLSWTWYFEKHFYPNELANMLGMEKLEF